MIIFELNKRVLEIYYMGGGDESVLGTPDIITLQCGVVNYWF